MKKSIFSTLVLAIPFLFQTDAIYGQSKDGSEAEISYSVNGVQVQNMLQMKDFYKSFESEAGNKAAEATGKMIDLFVENSYELTDNSPEGNVAQYEALRSSFASIQFSDEEIDAIRKKVNTVPSPDEK